MRRADNDFAFFFGGGDNTLPLTRERHPPRRRDDEAETNAICVSVGAYQSDTNLALCAPIEEVPSSTDLHVTALRRASVEQIAAIAQRAIEAGVAIQILSWFAVNPIEQAGIVLGYGGIATDQIEEGLRRLRRCFRN